MNKKDLRIKELEEELQIKNREIEALENKNNFLANSVSGLEDEVFKYEELFYSSNILFAIFLGEDHIIDVANKSIRDAWGKGNNVIGKPLLELLPELKNQGVKELLDEVYQTGVPFFATEVPVDLMIDGKSQTRYFDFTYQPQKNKKGEVIGVADIATDVTKHALLNKMIKKSEKEFRELLNFMPHKISLADSNGQTLFCNKSWLDYTGKTEKEFIEQPFTTLVFPENSKKVEAAIAEGLETGEDIDIEVQLKNKDGDYQWHLCRATSIKDDDGNITSWISSSTEIQKLKEEEKRKEDFLKLVSHELKTPVTSIKGYVQLLLALLPNNNGETEKRLTIKPYLNRIETQVERLIRLLSELLDMSRIENNELELKCKKFNLNKHVEEIIEDLTYSYKNVQIELNNEYNCEVYADRDRIGQVLINFLTNALKYSPENERVQIRIYQNKADEVGVCVKDNGIGIDSKEQQNIFKRFYRISGNNDDTYSGFGIGLYLSNEIIEKHHGKIHVNSELGEGSEFTFTLPIKQL